MADEFKNKIKRLELENFTCFPKIAFDFSPGINVFIGENGTGKTHLLKVLYACLELNFTGYPLNEHRSLQNMEDTFVSHFGKPKVGYLKRRGKEGDNSQIKLSLNNLEFYMDFNPEEGEFKWVSLEEKTYEQLPKRLFLPVQEMLSWQNGFIFLYQNREVDFDKTYLDLAVALQGRPLKGESLIDAKKLIKDIEQLGIKVWKKDEEFFISINNEGPEIEAALSATGINKIAQLIYLVFNGSLTKDSILFWDEPAVNLNPKYITIVSKFLQTLAKAGCQIFVATHDYLVVHQLSTAAEYRDIEPDIPDMKFFSLIKGKDGIEVESGATLSEINHNPILDEYAALYDRENSLFQKSLINEQT